MAACASGKAVMAARRRVESFVKPELQSRGAHAAGVSCPAARRTACFDLTGRWNDPAKAVRIGFKSVVRRVSAGRRNLHAGRVRSPGNFAVLVTSPRFISGVPVGHP